MNWWVQSGHTAVKHAACTRSFCNICEGGLTVCARCNLAEGSLTTHCPGMEAHVEHGDAVYVGKEDYYNGQWVSGRRTVFMYPEDYPANTDPEDILPSRY